MDDVFKLKYKVGEIEFEAEGSADAVEQQRINFMKEVLPAAIDAMVRTRAVIEQQPYINATAQPAMLEAGLSTDSLEIPNQLEKNFSRTSLSSFLKKYGPLSDQDFTLFAAYFDEEKNGTKAFSNENVKQYYQEGRRPAYSNNFMLLRGLIKKGYIMDTSTPNDAPPGKYYMLTDAGISYIENYIPKGDSGDKKKSRTNVKRSASKVSEAYVSITADDLNTKNYPAVKSLHGSKEQVIMVMYIVSSEGKGEWFTVDDIIHLLVNVFEVPADKDKVNGVFKRNKSLFFSEKDPINKKAFRRKLLSGAKDFAASIIQKANQ